MPLECRHACTSGDLPDLDGFKKQIEAQKKSMKEMQKKMYLEMEDHSSLLTAEMSEWRKEAEKKQKERKKREVGTGEKDGGNCNIW